MVLCDRQDRFYAGAAVAFGLMGMAEAIKARASDLRIYWEDFSGNERYDTHCRDCGTFLTRLVKNINGPYDYCRECTEISK